MKTGKVCFGKNCFEVEVAESLKEKTRGLMFRESMPEDKGMLFPFAFEFIHAFTMRNVKFPLDIIWLNSNFEVVHIEKSADPCAGLFCKPIIPTEFAKYVLEINAWLTDKFDIKIGDRATIQY